MMRSALLCDWWWYTVTGAMTVTWNTPVSMSRWFFMSCVMQRRVRSKFTAKVTL